MLTLVTPDRLFSCSQSLSCKINERNKIGKPTSDLNLLLVKYYLLQWAITVSVTTNEEMEEMDCWMRENGC